MRPLHQVLHAFFNPHSFTLALPDVWAGFQVNLRMMFIAEALVLVFALIVAMRSERVLCRAGNSPKMKPVPSESAAANTSIEVLSWS